MFLVAAFLIYWPAARTRLGALSVLLFANYFFCAKWDLLYLWLVPVAATCDYLVALALEKTENATSRRILLGISICLNIGLIALLKLKPGLLTISLSFYAFQSMSYTLDVYRRDAKPSNSLLAYLTAVSFFPAILAGPITRPALLIPQLERRSPITTEDSGRAFFLIALGLVKKLLIADFLAENLVNRVFDLPALYSGFEVLVGVYGYAFQLYYDFSGYTDIAIGSALLLGLKLPINFNRPYASENIADFWRRWHITLSNWLRDYVYFSLPGLRSKRKFFTYCNLVITMLVGGLWHGIGWTYAVWGALHGIGLAAARALQSLRGRREPSRSWYAATGRAFVTFQFVCFAWIFFRAPNLDTAWAVLNRISSFTFATGNLTPSFLFVLLVGAFAHFVPRSWYDASMRLYICAPFYAQAGAMALLVLFIQNVTSTGSAPFVYARF